MTTSTETKDLIASIQKKYGYTLLELSQKVGVTEAALSRWNNGKSEPTRKNLMVLKAILSEPSTARSANQSDFQSLILGRLDQLTRQIADLQASHGETRGMVNAKLEGVSDTIAGIERRVRATELRQAAQNKKREVGEKSGRKHL